MKRIPWFDRKPPSLRPDLPTGRAPRASAVQDAAKRHRRSRRNASWTARARRYNQNHGLKLAAPLRGTSPQILLVHWWEVLT
ncbi:MAG: hypothetical protein ACLQJR_18265, partial [Stellaceae bacterium]